MVRRLRYIFARQHTRTGSQHRRCLTTRAGVSTVEAAKHLALARSPDCSERVKIGSLPSRIAPTDESSAYEVQDELHQLLQQPGVGLGKIVGHKIGCTTKVMQDYLGMPHPCAGAIYESTVCSDGEGNFDCNTLWRPGVECELAVQLSADICALPSGLRHTRETVSLYVGDIMAAIELVDDRYIDFEARNPGWPTWVADDLFGAGCVLGRAIPSQCWSALDLASIRGEMWINGISVGSGFGRDIINGHPFEALAWLANMKAERGEMLMQGDIILLGSVVQTKWLQRGDHVKVVVEGLGQAELHLQ